MSYKDPQKRKEYNRNYMKKWQKGERFKEIQKKYRETHQETLKAKRKTSEYRMYQREKMKTYRKERHLEVLKLYGGNPPKCTCCGEAHLEFLTIHHINKDGKKQRQEIGDSGSAIYDWLYKQPYQPEKYSCLCMNCNHAIQHYGGCPHKEKIEWKISPEKGEKITHNIYIKYYLRRVRNEVIKKYGAKCDCCGEANIEFLTIDHIKGDGREDRKRGIRGSRLYQKLYKIPLQLDKYRILCINCNRAYGLYNYCQHKK